MLSKSLFLSILATINLVCSSSIGQNEGKSQPIPRRIGAYKSSSSWRQSIPKGLLDSLPNNADSVFSSEHFNFYSFGKWNPEQVKLLSTELETGLTSLVKRFGIDNTIKLKVILYPSSEIKGLILGNSRRAQIDSTLTAVHLVLDSMYASLTPSEPLEIFLLNTLGNSKVKALTCGLAIVQLPMWQRLGHRELSFRLASADLIPDLQDLLNLELWSTYSDVIASCLTASFTEYLLTFLPTDKFLNLYLHATVEDLTQYEFEWREWLKANTQGQSFRSEKKEFTYLKGFNFSHEGYQIFNGYGSRQALESLKRTKELGSNAVAIVPYSFLRDAKKPAPIPIARFSGGENDEAVMASCYQAQSLGMYTLLKPQIWLGRGQWPGDIEMTSESDWKLFFKYYTYWIAHYALLATIYQVDGLCLGTELKKTTLQRPDDWRYLVNRIRKLFAGHLTYAANWGEEFEQLTFWNELDFIGLNNYYPLSTLEEPSDNDLRIGLRETFKKVQASSLLHNKRVVLTEIGFPTTKHPWIEPHRDGVDSAVDFIAQARCFRLMFEELNDQPWCGGLFIWKWPSYLRTHHGESATFHIHSLPSEAIIRDWYQKRTGN